MKFPYKATNEMRLIPTNWIDAVRYKNRIEQNKVK